MSKKTKEPAVDRVKIGRRWAVWVLTAAVASGLTGCVHTPTSSPTPSPDAAQQSSPSPESAHRVAPVVSAYGFEATVDRLRSALVARGLTLFAEVDHAAGARKAGLELEPSHLFIFGNPKGGTPLMRANPALGLDLPLKALVYEQDEVTLVLTTDIQAVAARAGVSEPQKVLYKVSGVLAGLVDEATAGSE